MLEIRQANLVDAMLLSALGCSIYRAHFTHLWVSEHELNAFLESEYSRSAVEQSLQDRSVSWYVAETERPMGFAKVTQESTIPGTAITGMLLNKLYLDPTQTSKGYGQIMFETCKQWARDSGTDFLWLEVLEQNERATRFYEKQGMRHIKSTVFKTASQQSVLNIMGISV